MGRLMVLYSMYPHCLSGEYKYTKIRNNQLMLYIRYEITAFIEVNILHRAFNKVIFPRNPDVLKESL